MYVQAPNVFENGVVQATPLWTVKYVYT